MILKSKVGASGVASMIAGLRKLTSILEVISEGAYPAMTEESVTFPELSDVKKTYDCPLTPTGTTALNQPFSIDVLTGRIIRPLTNVA